MLVAILRFVLRSVGACMFGWYWADLRRAKGWSDKKALAVGLPIAIFLML